VGYIQIIELTTDRPDEVEALIADWRSATEGRRTARRGTFTRDRDRADVYVQIVEFPSYDDAVANSRLPETEAFATRLAGLSQGPVRFRNLDVRSVEEL